MHYYKVAPTKVVRDGVDYLTYEYDKAIETGSVVRIPVGKFECVGIVLGAAKRPEFMTKPIIGMLEISPLPMRLIRTAKWMSNYYATPFPQVLSTILPSGLSRKRRKNEDGRDVKTSAHRTNILLNKYQRAALDNIAAVKNNTVLLHGITGSGKTNIYLELARRQFESGKSAIVLVPEIALTSQIVNNFQQQFGNSVVVVHSNQTEATRHITWKKILDAKQPLVVIGPRSALFAPIDNLGVIIIDEAHEPSYKQEQAPKYNALRVATMMAKFDGIKVVLGTATPSIADYYLADQYRAIVKLEHLANSDDTNGSSIEVVDIKDRSEFTKHRFISNKLISAVEKSLDEGRQCLVFHNRRGSASLTVCMDCGWQALCDECSLPMTLHEDKYQLVCHTCGRSQTVFTNCPECGGAEIIHKGIGTKLIETELKRLFSNANIARFDGDTPDSESLNEKYDMVRSGEVQIIIGTQVVAKGFDLPLLSVVGVVQADSGLVLPDFSSEERTFQLLMQVLGRVGRGYGKSKVVVQTYRPTDGVVKCGVSRDYEAFYKEALLKRKRGRFPPYSYLLKLVCSYKTERSAINNARGMAKEIQISHPNVEVLGPMPAFYERTKEYYRWQLVVRGANRTELLKVADSIRNHRWQKDIDPSTLL